MSTIKSNTILKSTLTLASGIIISRVTGFVREIVLAAVYGVGTISDAFIIAFAIPDSLLIFIGASVAAGFISMYHQVESKTLFTRNVMTCLCLLGILFSIVFSVFPNVLVRLFAFNIAPETFEYAVFFTRYMVWTAVFIFLIHIYGAYLEIEGAFFFPGIRLVWRNVMVIFSLILGLVYGYILPVALSPVVGTAISLVVMSLVCRKRGFIYRPYLYVKSPDLKYMTTLIVPIVLASASNQINLIITRNFAASLPVGAISFLNYSHRVTGLFIALFGYALFTVLYPYMSKLAADGDIQGLKRMLIQGVVRITAIMLPICIGLIVLAESAVRIMFERGNFTPADTINTAASLRMYAMFMLAGCLNPLLIRVFYAIHAAPIPAYLSIVSVAAGIGFNFLLIGRLGAEGLALSVSLSGLLLTLLLLGALRKKIGHLGLKIYLSEFMKIVLATVIMGIGVWIAAGALPLRSISVWQEVTFCTVLAVAAALVYYILLLLMKSKIAFDVAATAAKFLKRWRVRT